MDRIAKFYTMETGVEKEMVLMVMDVRDKGLTKKGEPFVAVDLFDGVKIQAVNFFSETIDTMREKGVTKGSILKVYLTHGSDGYYNQRGWELNTDVTITEKDFVHAAPIDPDMIFDWLLKNIQSVDSNPDGTGPYNSISNLALNLLKENADAFKRSSAAVAMHHNFLSGLLYHTARMVGLAKKICDIYKSLDRELLICATALHDIGKITCYETTDIGEANVTVTGRLLDHAVVGIMMIHDAAKVGVYNPERLEMLTHMIASHHGKIEWGAITTPAFPEAEMLHIIDLADSRMNMYEEAFKEQTAGTLSEKRVYGLENSHIYKPMYNEESK